MQIDMHYYGTYALAMTAGINPEFAQKIATSAQFVDDYATKKYIEFRDAGKIDSQATAHHALNIKNILPDDQRQVWVPFHFLPGNEGTEFTERLVCRKNSAIAQEMVAMALNTLDDKIGPYRLGITAHVYADTFAHYGFSGVSSRRNRICNDTITFEDVSPGILDYIKTKAAAFASIYPREEGLIANIKSWFGETCSGALGHGAVATYPDRPYLIWQFEYEEPKVPSGQRNNPETFLEGCQELHAMFFKAAQVNPAFGGGVPTSFEDIKDTVQDILKFQGKGEERKDKWLNATKQGKLGPAFEIRPYLGEEWLSEITNLHDTEISEVALTAPGYLFCRAASAHRQYILRELLPKFKLIVA